MSKNVSKIFFMVVSQELTFGDNYTKTIYIIRSRNYFKMMIINNYFSHNSCLQENSKNVQNKT